MKRKRKENKQYIYFYLLPTCILFLQQDSCFSECLSQSILASVLLLLRLFPPYLHFFSFTIGIYYAHEVNKK